MLATHGDDAIFRFINLHHNSFLDVFMYRCTLIGEGSVIVLVLLVLLGIASLRNWWYLVAAILCNVLPSLVVQLIKRNVGAPRPLKYYNEESWIHILPSWPRLMENSFPSGHTTGAFCFLLFLSILLPTRFKALGFLFFILAMLVAYSRIYLAVHFFVDVYIGSIIATVFVTSVIFLMNKYQAYFFKG